MKTAKSIRIPKETKQALKKLIKAFITKTATAEYLCVHRLTLSNLLERETCDPETLKNVNEKVAEWEVYRIALVSGCPSSQIKIK